MQSKMQAARCLYVMGLYVAMTESNLPMTSGCFPSQLSQQLLSPAGSTSENDPANGTPDPRRLACVSAPDGFSTPSFVSRYLLKAAATDPHISDVSGAFSTGSPCRPCQPSRCAAHGHKGNSRQSRLKRSLSSAQAKTATPPHAAPARTGWSRSATGSAARRAAGARSPG